MKKEKVLFVLKQIITEIVGSLIFTTGIYNFAVNGNFPVAGFSGVALIIYQLFGVPMGLSLLVINIPLALLCYRLIGKNFFFASLRCMLISSFIIDFISPKLPVYTGDRLLAAVVTGVLCGLGYTMIYMVNSSTGGIDFVTMAIKNKKPHVPLGRITFLLDTTIIILGGFLFSDIDGIIFGIIESYIIAIVANKMMYGVNSGKMTLIVTENGKKICDVIDEVCQRGSTIIPAYGGYTENNREVVLCACNDKEMYLVQKAVKKADPGAFLIVLASDEVHGEGFKTVSLGEKEG